MVGRPLGLSVVVGLTLADGAELFDGTLDGLLLSVGFELRLGFDVMVGDMLGF